MKKRRNPAPGFNTLVPKNVERNTLFQKVTFRVATYVAEQLDFIYVSRFGHYVFNFAASGYKAKTFVCSLKLKLTQQKVLAKYFIG